MCGILVSSNYYFKNKNFNLDLISHRGPDISNFVEIDNILFGHTLLSIRDSVDNSIQPIRSECKKFLILFNGQIYNTKNIVKNFDFTDTNLDTKVISMLIGRVGLNFYKYIDGMYAIVLYSLQEKKIYLYRDTSGQKNLYFKVDKNGIIICSEIKPIIKISNEIKLNVKEFIGSLSFGYSIKNETIYKNIFKTMPGTYITIDPKKLRASKPVYFLDGNLYFPL